jgi:hypothetical protein
MKNFLDSQRGARILILIDLGPNRTPSHYYQGQVISVGDGFVIVKDETLGEISIATDKIVACKLLSEAATGLDTVGAILEGFER